MPTRPVTGYPQTQAFDDPCCRASYAKFNYHGHNGIDIGCPIGTPVHAPEDGVAYQYNDPYGYGRNVVLAGDSGRQWIMGHLSDWNIPAVNRVVEGATIGYSGNTGNSTGPHLHYGVRPPNPDYSNGFGGYIDPEAVFVLPTEPEPDLEPPPPPPTEEDEEMALTPEEREMVELARQGTTKAVLDTYFSRAAELGRELLRVKSLSAKRRKEIGNELAAYV